MKHCVFLSMLCNNWSALGYITSYNELYNGFLRTLLCSLDTDGRHTDMSMGHGKIQKKGMGHNKQYFISIIYG